MSNIEGLNPEQLEAVGHEEGPMLVVAGAGTGKTKVITSRIAHLIELKKAKPGEILALTFTEKAAREMEERLYGLIGWESFSVPVMTFHAFGTELLGRFASHIGRSIGGGLLNDTQKSLLLTQQVGRINLSYYAPQSNLYEFIEGVVQYINLLQNATIGPEQYLNYVDEIRTNSQMHPRDIEEQSDLANLYKLYEQIKEETGTYDFHDQIGLPLRILQERPNLAERLGREYKYVLVDEYQDTNRDQDALLRTFVGRSGNLFAVGDDDQAIYGFRGADIGNILSYTKHFDVAKSVVLTRNYRSGQRILDVAYQLITKNNPDRLEDKLRLIKKLIAEQPEGQATYIPYASTPDEQDGVLKEIAARIRNGESPAGIAVLASTHGPLKLMAKTMRSRGIPFAMSTTVSIFDQPELISLWYLLKWIAGKADDEEIGHVAMGPLIGWSHSQYHALVKTAKDNMTSIEEALAAGEEPTSKEMRRKLAEWRRWSEELPASRLVYQLIFETGRANEWRDKANKSPRMVRVFEDLQRFLSQIQDFESVSIDSRLTEYLKIFPLPPTLDVQEPVGDLEGVQLLTVHAAKGLEFETVYLIGCTQRNWSGQGVSRAWTIPEQLKAESDLPPEHELRRLMYVAVTRAKRNLFVSCALQGPGGGKQTPSRFIEELFGTEAIKQLPANEKSEKMEFLMQQLQRYYPMQTTMNELSLPFENSQGWLDLSVTQLGLYDICPFEFYLEHVLQIKQPVGPQLEFGKNLHAVFEAYFKAKLAGLAPSPVDLHKMIDVMWSEKGYERKETALSDLALAHKTLDSFIGRQGDRVDREITAAEQPVHFEIPAVKLKIRGKIDALFDLGPGIEIADFKTGRNKTDPEKLARTAKDSFQLRTYALAYQINKGVAPEKVTLDYVVTGIEGSANLSTTILKNHREKLGEMAGRIRALDFKPTPSPNHTCSAFKFYGTGELDEIAEMALSGMEAK
jgi:DNA helicase-2/ATP-dependent DNA helicase PcrA